MMHYWKISLFVTLIDFAHCANILELSCDHTCLDQEDRMRPESEDFKCVALGKWMVLRIAVREPIYLCGYRHFVQLSQ